MAYCFTGLKFKNKSTFNRHRSKTESEMVLFFYAYFNQYSLASRINLE
jgi:hypothetical protein